MTRRSISGLPVLPCSGTVSDTCCPPLNAPACDSVSGWSAWSARPTVAANAYERHRATGSDAVGDVAGSSQFTRRCDLGGGDRQRHDQDAKVLPTVDRIGGRTWAKGDLGVRRAVDLLVAPLQGPVRAT